MPQWISILLLLVFAVHLFAFLTLAIRRRSSYHTLVAAVFAALVFSFSLRLLAPEITLLETPLYQLFRYLAWALAAVTLPWLLLRLLHR